MNGPRDHALELLQKAGNDLIAANATIATGEALDTVCFHAQQAVEKSLKALLALRDVEYPWRHDLGELLALAGPQCPELRPMEEEILALSPYAVEIRYGAIMPDIDDARAALDVAARVHGLAERLVKGQDSTQKE
jgi:HEPN domain-containing protein